jgi:hypothetical protein
VRLFAKGFFHYFKAWVIKNSVSSSPALVVELSELELFNAELRISGFSSVLGALSMNAIVPPIRAGGEGGLSDRRRGFLVDVGCGPGIGRNIRVLLGESELRSEHQN